MFLKALSTPTSVEISRTDRWLRTESNLVAPASRGVVHGAQHESSRVAHRHHGGDVVPRVVQRVRVEAHPALAIRIVVDCPQSRTHTNPTPRRSVMGHGQRGLRIGEDGVADAATQTPLD